MRIRRAGFAALLLAQLAFTVGCMSEVPITGRKQLSLVPTSSLNSMAYQQYRDFLKQHKLSKDAAKTAMVRRVGVRIQHAVEKYFREHGMRKRLRGYDWQFNLVEDKQKNAFCMPGGRVVVYTGILPVTRDETGLAVVLGHEIAHAVAGHHSERASQQMLMAMGGLALSQAVKKKPKKTQMILMGVYGAGASLGILLPYSRLQESEADKLGLIFMAMAGYDPHAAVGLWQRMDKSAKGKHPPAILSTHPLPKTRIRRIRKAIPGVMKYYRKPAEKPAMKI